MNREILPVLDEISAVLKKHDMIGLVFVGNKTHVDFRLDVEASWSCAKIENCGDLQGVRLRCLAEDYPTKEAMLATLERTIGTLVSMDHGMDAVQENIINLLETIQKTTGLKILGRSTREE